MNAPLTKAQKQYIAETAERIRLIDHRTEEKLHAAVVSLMVEFVAVTLFLSCGFVWLAIYATR